MLRKIDLLTLIMLLLIAGVSQAAFTPVFEYSFPASYAGSGSTVTDLSSAGNDATLWVANSSLVNERPTGYASSLKSINGANRGKLDTNSLLDSQTVAAAGGFTMDVWVKWDGVSGHQKTINYGNADMIKTYNSDLYFMLGSGAGGSMQTSISSGTWYHVVAVFDTLGNAATEDLAYPGYYQVIGEMSLYLDGALIDIESATKTSMGDRSGKLVFGCSTNMVTELWGGAIFNPSVYLGVPASVTLVSPPDGDDDVLVDDTPTLEWISGTDPAIIEHVLYFSADDSWVTNALPTDPAAIVLPVAAETYQHPEALAYGTEYFWRIDEATGDVSNPDNIKTGPVWSFTTEILILPVSPVSPSDDAAAVSIDDAPTLEWVSGTDPAIIEHVLYFSTDENWVTNALPTDSGAIVLPVETETYQHSGLLAYGTEYFWRIDEATGDVSNPDNVETGPVWSFTTDQNLNGTLPGSGTQQDPYCIEDLVDFGAFIGNSNYWDKYTRLDRDLNLDPDLPSRQNYTKAPVAGDANTGSGFSGTPFTGHFDGNGHVISNLTMIGDDYCGLFGKTNSGAEIIDLELNAVSIESSSSGSSTGGLVGYNSGSIINCNVSGVIVGYYSIGGLVGVNTASGSISGSDADCVVKGIERAGGLLGYNSGGSVSGSYSAGDVQCIEKAGGLVGENTSSGRISNSHSACTVDGVYYVGGLVGQNSTSGTIARSFASGEVDGIERIGGLVGQNASSGDIVDSYASGEVVGISYAGGLVGENTDSGSSITSSYAAGRAIGADRVGGLVGQNKTSGSISVAYAAGAAKGIETVGGLVGENSSTGNLSITYAVGIASGHDYVGDYENGYAAGDIGGLIGENYGSPDDSFWYMSSSTMVGVGNEDPDPTGVSGKTEAEMQTESTFTAAGWDFVGESTNGVNELWRMCTDGVEYPRLSWQFAQNGDFTCGDGVDMLDLQSLAGHWLMIKTAAPTTFNTACDANGDGVINLADYSALGENW